MAIHVTIKAAVALAFLCASSFALAQNNGNNRREEKRENERVRNAEQDVSHARKRISELQNELRSQLRKFDSVQDKVVQSKVELRDARDAAESELGAKLGIPECLANIKEKRKVYDELCKPVIDSLHESPEWRRLESEATSAKQSLASLREDVELSDEERASKVKELNDIVFRTFSAENQAINLNPNCVMAKKDLDDASQRLQEIRKKLTPETVNSHRLVVTANKSFIELDKQFSAIDREIAKTRSSIVRAQRELQQAIANHAKAKQADASDKNSRDKKNQPSKQ